MVNKIAVIGDKDSVLAFKSLGLDVFFAETYFDIKNTLEKLAEDYAVILITEQAAEQVDELLLKYKKKCFPTVIPIPSGTGSTGYGMNCIKSDVEKAIGTDILS